MQSTYRFEEYHCRDPLAYHRVILILEQTFSAQADELISIKRLARRVREGVEKMNPFIQQANLHVCRRCASICCINKHGYYNREDLVYLFSLGMEPPPVIFGKNDTEPCQYLRENGCSMERWRRPSGCNWYFCDALLDYMEPQPAYREFDETLTEVAECWLEMVEEFRRITASDF